MVSNHKKAVIIGETRLCTQCAEYLLNNNWKVISIVSDDKLVIEWANKNSVSIVPIDKLGTIELGNFYLFSIINPHLIPDYFLTNKKLLLALNYHDSPLPKYAGVNSTTWAIINNEKQHGVTLHKIEHGVDEGDIAAKSMVSIEEDETTISLNLKCSEHLLALFKEVITKINAGTLKFSKQNLANRTYYGLKSIPDNYGIINGIKDIETLSRLARGLTFGDEYDNPVATTKVALNGQFYIVEDFNNKLIQDSYKHDNNTVLFNTTRDIYGNKTNLKIKYKDISKIYSINNDDLQYLSNIKSQERKYKKQIVNFLEDHSDASLKILDYTLDTSNNHHYKKKINFTENVSISTLSALVCFILARFFRDNFIVSLYLTDEKVSSSLRNLVDNRNFICIHKNILDNSFGKLEEYLADLQKNYYSITKDFGYRYQLQLLTDVAITIGDVTSTDNHRMVIRIKDNEIEVQGDTSCKLQIDSIAEAITTLSSESIINELVTADLKHFNILNQAQYQKIVIDYNKTERDYPKDKTVHQLFEEQVLKTPDNIAVVYEDKKLTYKELNQKANQLANYLRANYKIKPDDLIVLCLDRSEQMLIAILGVLKAGGAYVPVDPNYPNDRIGYILCDTKAKIALTNDIYTKRLQDSIKQKAKNINIIALDSKKINIKLASEKSGNLAIPTTSNNVIYVIYTSGTTGNPKGVLVEHHSVVNYIIYLIGYNKLDSKSIGSQFAALSFDASVPEIYPMLLSGGALYIVPDRDKPDPAKTNNFFNKNRITQAFLPTKFAELFLELKNSSLTNLLVAGERLEKFIEQPYRVSNGYGPTEATVHTTNFIVDKQYKNIPIGKPINNVKCYLVDNHLNLLPIGAIGELMIGGESLARGYFNRPDLTEQKFISNPFQTKEEKSQNKNSRLYKTGDLVRMLSDGNLEYISRNDSQVKIRGYRIELGEIENKLMSYPEIKQVVVLVKERIAEYVKDKYLLAYYVADKKLDETKMLAYLATLLPEYMLPQVFMHLSNLPLTINGKLDKGSLPEPELTSPSEYVAPRNELEKKICEMYSHVLNLPIQQVGIKNDFFRMGGDSISAIQLVSRIRQQLEFSIAVKDIFNHRSIGQLVLNVLAEQSIQKEKAGKTNAKDSDEDTNQKYLYKIQKNKEADEVYLANNLQQGFIYHASRYGKTDGSYLLQFYWQYKSPIDENKFRRAWELVQKKYPSLRLKFAWGKELIQIIDKNQKLKFRYIDLTNLNIKTDYECQYQITNITTKGRREHYDLRKGSLIRIYLIKFSENNYYCLCIIHHIILDAWSASLLLSSLHEIYSQLLENHLPQISEDVIYKKVQKYLQAHKNENQLYWSDCLKQIEDRVDLKSLLKTTARNTQIKYHLQVAQEQEQCAIITGQKLDKLKEVCQTNAITLSAMIQYAWHKILHIYSASNTTVAGTVVSGRDIPVDGIEDSVGLFINTLPLVFIHDNKLSLLEQIKVIQNSINEINNRSNTSLAGLQADGERLFDSLLIYENYPLPRYDGNIKFYNMEQNFKVDYPLAVVVYEKKQTLMIKLKYAGELFSQETISQVLSKLLFFIEQVLENPYKRTLDYLNHKEYQRLIINYNKTEKDCPTNKTIHQIFEEQVLKTPNDTALVCEGRKFTYKELNNKANQLANYILKNNDIKPDDLIALILERDEHIIISALAVMKTGAAYVPINPGYPRTRIEYILRDADAKIIIEGKNNEYKAQGNRVIKIDSDEFQQCLSNEDVLDPRINVTSSNLIYVIYTSGTTGNPKGVAVEHHSVVNYVMYLINYCGLNSKSIGSQCAQLGFDVSVTEIYTILLSGGVLHIMPDKIKFVPEQINDFFYKHHVNYAFLPTKLAELFFEFKNTNLSYLIVIGEKLEKFINQPYRVINGYGPTEATVHVTDFMVDKPYDNIPIGKAINNAKCYVVDDDLNPLPAGVIGELVIGGEVLARNYHNKPQITAEKFVPNPFQTSEEKSRNKNNRLYKTGDMVRMLSDGNIEYIGRKDFQIKIMGHRIEFGEIENKLINYPEINLAIVTASEESGNKHLIAYYMSNRKLEEQKIKDYLTKQLPHHMIPQVFVYIQKLPLTKNGKLDRKALPKPEFIDKNSYIAPKSKQEQLVCEAFKKILNLEKIGLDHDFFSLGGNSIQAIKLVSILQENFAIKIADIFELRTPRKIAHGSIFRKGFLQQKLEQVKLAYKQKQDIDVPIKKKVLSNLNYLKSVEKLRVNVSLMKPISGVLLTGSTGFLGSNILNQLLELTNYKIYLSIRSISQADAIERINKRYRFYFDKDLNKVINTRIFIFNADIEQDYLGLSQIDYQNLTAKVDSIIHAAALVKHYGEYDKFYSANVKATINLLEFAKLTKLKDFHYISTTGVLTYLSILNDTISSCTEDDLPIPTEILNNVYAQTKLLGEHQVTKYQYSGLNCNIYRVGNLAFMLKKYRTQENIEDNAFYNWLKCLFTMKRATNEIINKVEISQTDLTAQAIVKIFDKKSLSNQTYHVFNPHLYDMEGVLKNNGLEITSVDTFIDCVAQYAKDYRHYDSIVRFLLYQGWLDSWEKRDMTPIEILQNKTEYVLRKLGFVWPSITEEVIDGYFKAAKLNI